MFGISEIAILLIVVVVLGAKRLPDLARSAGKAARILKSEGKAMKAEDSADQQSPPHIIQAQPVDGSGPRLDGTPGRGPART